MRILVTGANGFVGRALCQKLTASGVAVLGTIRSVDQVRELPTGVIPVVLKSLDDLSGLESVAGTLDGVVHLAARVHQMKETALDPLSAFRAVNTQGTTNLAEWAANHRIKRFVFLSSVKVNGEGQSDPQQAYSEADIPAPHDPYGISKWEAEQSLTRLGAETGLQTVILRPTLIYGPNVRANFLQLMKLVRLGLPIPLGGVCNARSLLFVGNLVDAIRISLIHPRAAGQTFLVSDGGDLSTPALIRELAFALNKPSRLISISPKWLEGIGRITGRSATVRRLTGSLCVDSSKIRETLNWQPPFTVSEGLHQTAKWYQSSLVHKEMAARAA